jgi:hypothetical protein
MDFLGPALEGFGVVFQPSNLLYCFLGVLIGMLIGVLPGLGPVATIAILLPITYNIEPASAIILLAGIFYGAQYGGTITSVLLQLPGESSAVVTTFDGYQMARQGRAGPAAGDRGRRFLHRRNHLYYRPHDPGPHRGRLCTGIRPAGVRRPGAARHTTRGHIRNRVTHQVCRGRHNRIVACDHRAGRSIRHRAFHVRQRQSR